MNNDMISTIIFAILGVAIVGTMMVAITLLPFVALAASPFFVAAAIIRSDWYHEWVLQRRARQLYKVAREIAPVPEPPAVADSVSGAQYRDMLLDVINGVVEPDPIPIDKKRFEHIHMVASIGHGKTQSMQYFISRDLEHLGERSVIVIDSQGEMINNILKSDIPKEDIMWINPRDEEYPPAFNLFSEKGTLQSTNATIETYEYIMGGIFGADLTSKMGVVFRYVIRLLLTIPDATIDTLLDVFRDHTKYQSYITAIGGTVQDFFEEDFSNRQYNDTRTQVIRRIQTIRENEQLYRMFSSTVSKIDLFDAMDSGKLILIDTAKDTLKEEGSRILGRFFIAKIVQAAQERAGQRDKTPCHIYIDEAQDYFDDRTEVFLSQLRKQKVGGFFAHQYLSQLPPKLQDAFMANTSTKMAGGVSMKDARVFASEMMMPPESIAKQPVGTFVTYVRGMPQGIAMDVPFFELENRPKRDDWEEMVQYQRQQYSTMPEPVEEPPKPDTVIYAGGRKEPPLSLPKPPDDDIDQPSYEP